MSDMQTRRYQPHLDLLRIFAAFCVILLHVLSPLLTSAPDFGTRTWNVANMLNEITRIGVPLFLMLTGCLLLPAASTKDFGKFYRRRLSRVLIPFLIWNLIYYIYNRTQNGLPVFDRAFFDQLINNGSEYHLWYVYTLIGIYLILPFLARMLESCTDSQILWLLVLTTFPTTLRPFLNITTPVYIYLFNPLLEGYLGYVILGHYLNRIPKTRLTAAAIPVCGIGGFAMGVCFNYFRSAPDALDFTFNGGYTLNHYLLATAAFLFARYLPLPQSGWFARILQKLSALTYTVYLAHVLVLAQLYKYLPMPTPAWRIAVYPFVCFALCMLLAFVLALIKDGIARVLPRRKVKTKE